MRDRARPERPVATGAASSQWRAYAAALAAGAALLAYGNLNALVEEEAREAYLPYANILLAVVLVLWLRRGYSADELGLAPGPSLRSAGWGFALGLLLALAPVAFVALAPFVTGEPVQAEEIAGLSGGGLAWRVCVRVPLGTALPEEVFFRGALFALWRRPAGLNGAVVATSVLFALWHLVISFGSVRESGTVEGAALVAAGYGAALAGLFAGGVFFAWLRLRSGSIAGAVTLHWSVVALMTVAVWARS